MTLRLSRFTTALLPLAVAALLCCLTPAARADRLDTEFEKLIGPALARNFGDTNGIDDDPLLANWVRRLGADVAARSPRKDIGYTFRVIATDTTNAFALPGGYIFASRGLLDEVDSDDELAAVLAHEAGHVAKRHATQQIGSQLLFQAVFLSLSDRNYHRFGEALNVFNVLRTLGKSREMEAQADEVGLEYAYAAGYDPAGMVAFFEGLGRRRISAVEQYFATHPGADRRIESARANPLLDMSRVENRERIAIGFAGRGMAGSAAAVRAGQDPLALTRSSSPSGAFPSFLGEERQGVIEQTAKARRSLSRLSGAQRVGNGLQQLMLVNSQLGDARWIYMTSRAYAIHERIGDVYGRTARILRSAPGTYDALAGYAGLGAGGSYTTINASIGRGEVRRAVERVQGVATPLSRAENACVGVLFDLNNRFLSTPGFLGWLRYLALEGTLRYAESELARADKRSGQAWRLLSMARVRQYEARLSSLIPEEDPERRALWFDLAQRRFGAAFPTAGEAGQATVLGALSVQLSGSVSDLTADKLPETPCADWVLQKKGTPENIATVMRMLTLELEREIAFRERYLNDRQQQYEQAAAPSP